MDDNTKGLTAAFTIIFLWLFSLIFLLSQDIHQIPIWIIIPGIIWQTLLYTGLFITAHDGMHGLVFPKNRKLNDSIGTLAVSLYALFSYKNLLTKHWEHHRHPASQQDPDFHDGQHPGLSRWYLRFMSNYLTWKQLVGMAIVFNILMYLFSTPGVNLTLFWVTPALLSTLQLFYFGTYLPHRELSEPYKDAHRARSNNYSVFWSFITCYHFGYHWEHHEYTHIAWWRLPHIRGMTLTSEKNNK
jgi:beta-carotene ketolase (CrtW type)